MVTGALLIPTPLCEKTQTLTWDKCTDTCLLEIRRCSWFLTSCSVKRISVYRNCKQVKDHYCNIFSVERNKRWMSCCLFNKTPQSACGYIHKNRKKVTHIYIYIYTHTHTYIYIYICVCVCLCMYICVHKCVYIYGCNFLKYLYICVCVYVYMCVYIYIYVYLYIYGCNFLKYLYICVCVYVYMCVCVYIYIYVCIYIYMGVTFLNMYIYIYVCVLVLSND